MQDRERPGRERPAPALHRGACPTDQQSQTSASTSGKAASSSSERVSATPSSDFLVLVRTT